MNPAKKPMLKKINPTFTLLLLYLLKSIFWCKELPRTHFQWEHTRYSYGRAYDPVNERVYERSSRDKTNSANSSSKTCLIVTTCVIMSIVAVAVSSIASYYHLSKVNQCTFRLTNYEQSTWLKSTKIIGLMVQVNLKSGRSGSGFVTTFNAQS